MPPDPTYSNYQGPKPILSSYKVSGPGLITDRSSSNSKSEKRLLNDHNICYVCQLPLCSFITITEVSTSSAAIVKKQTENC